ncbi:hypothetical protein CDD81_1172 [Ophiocordyceps australis]|uniref:Rab-GAP TBC domain-containing protein n=1 Tax=Ophiocordyceps australis TaxID=1399860 RepID=A0A2C5XU36_9HYPO|nr:hypothetical protein CDD81_1172 [Ophiocordyceps australis]
MAAAGAHETPDQVSNMAHDSLVTVRLSEPSAVMGAHVSEPSQSDGATHDNQRDSSTTLLPDDAPRGLRDQLGEADAETDAETHAEAHDSNSCRDADEVNWAQLEKTEGEQVKDDETDNSTALLLARLEQENAKLATNPKSVHVQVVNHNRASKPRPPSMAQLRQMVTGPTPPALRYSMLPPPPMTDLEFYAALVKDYQQTAARLPTLLSNKIRKGIPPPLRGVVWQSMSGARDAALEEQYERFCGESSPYELLIGKDLGRSFPGVDMFREPDGDGQRMLGRVLRSFSLYDTKIGYCQGLGFLVGPLLMHMPDKQAFCVLVRLMERYDLRSCFLPDLSGLHVRIYQFRELLRLTLPVLSSRLETLQVETAYVSQWFLSFFAVTCPLPMLFRVYDVIFAEGASETLMRVALSLMRRNEARLLACAEMEDAMQLLLSRGLWDCYHYDADEFVRDFVSLTAVVTRERLAQLEQDYKESLVAPSNAPRASDITTAATRFLGRIWAPSAGNKSTTLTPGLAGPLRPLSMLRRSTSKQSLASTLNSIEASVSSSTSTDATGLTRDSASTEECSSTSRDSALAGSKASPTARAADEKYLHTQIEELLTALSELQRDHALATKQLEWEREEREEDRKAVRLLLEGLSKTMATEQRLQTDKTVPIMSAESVATPASAGSQDVSEAMRLVQSRLGDDDEKSKEVGQSRLQLKEELMSVKRQLASAVSQCQELSRRVHDMDHEMMSLKEQLRERQGHMRTLHQDKQRLEKQISGLRGRASASSGRETTQRDTEGEGASKGGGSGGGGLREFKLGRSKSTPTQATGLERRTSSLPQSQDTASGGAATGSKAASSAGEHEALLAELVQAKTAEAMAKQEAEEAKQRLEALRKSCGLGTGDSATTSPPSHIGVGVLGRLTGHGAADSAVMKPAAVSTTSPFASSSFWGWRR